MIAAVECARDVRGKEVGPLDESQLAQAMLRQFGVRIGPEMSKYALRRLEQGGASFPVMGGEARTGIPVRLLVDPAVLREHSPSVDQRA